MTNGRFDRLFGGPPRAPDALLEQRDMDHAASIQAVTDEVILRLVRSLVAETGLRKLCLAGGAALNCVANGRVLRRGNRCALGSAGGRRCRRRARRRARCLSRISRSAEAGWKRS